MNSGWMMVSLESTVDQETSCWISLGFLLEFSAIQLQKELCPSWTSTGPEQWTGFCSCSFSRISHLDLDQPPEGHQSWYIWPWVCGSGHKLQTSPPSNFCREWGAFGIIHTQGSRVAMRGTYFVHASHILTYWFSSTSSTLALALYFFNSGRVWEKDTDRPHLHWPWLGSTYRDCQNGSILINLFIPWSDQVHHLPLWCSMERMVWERHRSQTCGTSYKQRIWAIVVSKLQFQLNLANVGIMTLSYNKMQPLAIELARAMPQLYFPCIMLSVGEEMVHINKQLNPALVSMRWQMISVDNGKISSNPFYKPAWEHAWLCIFTCAYNIEKDFSDTDYKQTWMILWVPQKGSCLCIGLEMSNAKKSTCPCGCTSFAVSSWQKSSCTHTEQLVTNYIDNVCRYLQSKEIVGNRIFTTVLNLSNRAWNTYFNDERVFKNSTTKNLCRTVKNNI